jgi:hypothetical protein
MIKSAVVVALFWWLMVNAYGWLFLQPIQHSLINDISFFFNDFAGFTENRIFTLFMISILAGLWSLNEALSKRRNLFLKLLPHSKNGLHTSLGDVEIFFEEENQKKNERFALLTDSASSSKLGLLKQWEQIPQYFEFMDRVRHVGEMNPNHGLVFDELLFFPEMIYQYHAQRTYQNKISTKQKELTHQDLYLLHWHAIELAIRAQILSLTFNYKGVWEGDFKIPANDARFKLSPNDPMISMIAFCYAMLYSNLWNRKINPLETPETRHVKAFIFRKLSQLDCVQKLPNADRQALFFSLSFAHHPSQCTLNSKAQLIDDRSAALMMLVHETHQMLMG